MLTIFIIICWVLIIGGQAFIAYKAQLANYAIDITARLLRISNRMDREHMLSDEQINEIDAINIQTNNIMQLRRYKKMLVAIEKELGIAC